MKKLLHGFTLAEVLITLGIIGVVAAVTLPSLQVNVNKQALSTQMSKAYSQLSEGLRMYMTNNGLDEFDSANFNANTFARNYLQVQYVCNGTNDTNCFAPKYTSINGNSSETKASLMNSFNSSTNDTAVILRDGTVVHIAHNGAMLAFDVNNQKGPNKMGYDYHVAYINRDGSIGPSISSAFTDVTKRDAQIKKDLESCKKNGGDYGGMGCFAHLLRNNFKFDY
ncbi:MAG: type II secretion system GspH family protein [Muribaculaceae bacterium]|nr:type II secretion system GspH family protein [Muribaculaceae bacterium]